MFLRLFYRWSIFYMRKMYGSCYIFRIKLIKFQLFWESISHDVSVNFCDNIFQFGRRPKRCTNFLAGFLTLYEEFFNKFSERCELNLFQNMCSMSDDVGRIGCCRFHDSTQIGCVNVISIFRNEFLIQVVHLEFSPWRFYALRVMECSLYEYSCLIDVMDMFDVGQLHKSTQKWVR